MRCCFMIFAMAFSVEIQNNACTTYLHCLSHRSRVKANAEVEKYLCECVAVCICDTELLNLFPAPGTRSVPKSVRISFFDVKAEIKNHFAGGRACRIFYLNELGDDLRASSNKSLNAKPVASGLRWDRHMRDGSARSPFGDDCRPRLVCVHPHHNIQSTRG